MAREVVLVVDDDPALLRALEIILAPTFDTITCSSGARAIEIAASNKVGLALVDLKMPEMNGIEVLKKIKQIDDEIGVILISGHDSANSAVTALKLGAYDYITKPFDVDELLLRLSRFFQSRRLKDEVDYLKRELAGECGLSDIICVSRQMRAVLESVLRVAKTSSSVLITGESGTGKELIARAIQYNSDRKDRPFVVVNCGAVSAELIESELFGHEKGSFTGAHQRKIGKFEYADNGTVFLDEISTLPVALQTRLLRALQEKTFERVGGNESIKVDVRVIAATNVDLEDAIKKGQFREDLYYRLNVVPIHIAPLRERKDDIPLLVKHFLKKHSNKCKKSVTEVDPDVMRALCEYNWPGNVRELENLIERLVVLSRNARIVHEDLPVSQFITQCSQTGDPCDFSFKDACKVFEKEFILKVLARTGWNRGKAAEAMKMHRNTLLLKMKELGIRES